jgi:glutathione S-transferase
MSATHDAANTRQLTLFGRSSSLFTRVALIFAKELGVAYTFHVVPDLLSVEPADYGGHPALKLPTLRSPRGVWFGSLNICRELARAARPGLRVVWPEDLDGSLLGNAQELTIQAMTTEVALIMAKLGAGPASGDSTRKMRQSLTNTLSWLDGNVQGALARLPAERDVSYLEVSLFCLVTHLTFREVVPVAEYSALNEFCERFAARPSASETTYRFDP